MAMNISAPVQILRATQAEIAERTGANGELNWAEDTHELYIHDGVTKGGHLIAGGGGGSYSAGAGVKISDDGVISVRLDDAFATAESNISNGIIGRSDIFAGNLDTLDSGYSNIRRYYKIDSFATGSKPFGNISFILVDLGLSQVAIAESKIAVRSRTSTNNPWPEWVMLSGTSVTASDGISITDGAVAVDDTVVRTEGEQAINGSLRVWHYASAAVTVSKKDTDGNVNAKLSPNNLYFRFGDNARDFVSITSGGTASSMGNSTYARLTAHNDATMSSATLSVHATDEGTYTTAPSTRSTPVDDEIITYDYFRDHAVTLRTGNIYVDNVNGSDSNDGLTADTALATFDAAIALRQKCVFYNSDSGDSMVTINLAASDTAYSYSEYSIPNNTTITVYGSNTDGLSEADLNIIYLSFRNCYAKFEKINFTAMLNTNISNKYIMELEHSCVDMADCTIRDRNINGIIGFMQVESNSFMNFYPATILCHSNKGYDYIFQATSNSNIELDELSITGTNIVIKSNGAVIQTNNNSIVNIYTEGEMSSVTGKKYKCYNGSGINTHGLGANAIPGTEEGTVDGNSWYA